MSNQVLVLTLTGAVHRVVTARKALDLMRRGRVTTVLEADAPPLRWARGAVARPSVVYLTRPVPHVARGRRPTRRGVLERDHYTCAYCGGPGRTLDHVYPAHLCRKQGRPANTWENLVAACEPCQRRKGGRPLAEVGMRFRPGFAPGVPPYIARLPRPIPPAWEPYLGQ